MNFRPDIKLNQTIRLKRLLLITGAASIAVASFILFNNLGSVKNAHAAAGSETLDSGSFIINMGITPQNNNNALKPYGLIYNLMVGNNVPVKWVIEPAKTKDGADFIYNSVQYKGGTFIVPAVYITSSIKTIITTWMSSGVQGIYTTSPITVPVFATLTSFPTMIVDNQGGVQGFIPNYFNNAGIPVSTFTSGIPSTLTQCHDLWVGPHEEPNWNMHKYLYDLVTQQKLCIWSQCQTVSMLEGCRDPAPPNNQLNFLTSKGLKCWNNSAGRCGLINESHATNAVSPFNHYYAPDPVMQFMGAASGAFENGGEQWFQPLSTGQWLSTTKRLITTGTSTSPNEGALMVYGDAYGNSNYGLVMYEAGHNLTGSGNGAEKVAAQRAFLNYCLLVGKIKALLFSTYTIPSTFNSNETKPVSVTVTSGTPPYSYQWVSTVGGSFANPNAATTTFTSPIVLTKTNIAIKCIVTDACGRKNFIAVPALISTSLLPVKLTSFTANTTKENSVLLEWITASEKDNDYFTIEKSEDGKAFRDIAKIKGSGASNKIKKYSFIDIKAVKNYAYYRLKQTDFNGQESLSKTIVVKGTAQINTATKIFVYPNPFTNYININFEWNKKEELKIQIINMFGTVIYTDKMNAEEGNNSFQYTNQSNLPPGTYLLRLTTAQSIIGDVKINCRKE